MISSSSRQGFYLIFVLVLAWVSFFYVKMSIFQFLIISVFAQIIIKLTDIEEAIRN